MKVLSKVRVYQKDNTTVSISNELLISVSSVNGTIIKIQCEDGSEYTVMASDLIKAIQNATNIQLSLLQTIKCKQKNKIKWI